MDVADVYSFADRSPARVGENGRSRWFSFADRSPAQSRRKWTHHLDSTSIVIYMFDSLFDATLAGAGIGPTILPVAVRRCVIARAATTICCEY